MHERVRGWHPGDYRGRDTEGTEALRAHGIHGKTFIYFRIPWHSVWRTAPFVWSVATLCPVPD